MIEAWHFLPASRMTRYSNEYVYPGCMLKAQGEIAMCNNGMHASTAALDALRYAPGPILCRVRMHGRIVHGADKVVAEARECLWMADATETLHHFAVLQALSVAHLWDMPDYVRTYLMRGGDKDMQLAARNAAWAFRDAVWSKCRPTRTAPWSAARAAGCAIDFTLDAPLAAYAVATEAKWLACREFKQRAAESQFERLACMLAP